MWRLRMLLLLCASTAVFTVAVLIVLFDSTLLSSWFTPTSPPMRQINGGGKLKLFCWILTSNRFHDTRVLAVNETWPKRCDKYSFYTDVPINETLSIPHVTVFRNMTDGSAHLWPKTKVAMNYTFANYRTDFDWFLKADDDTFVFVENLRTLLARFDSTKPHYLGFRMKPYVAHGYNSGGAGYVLSRPALQLFVEHLLPNSSLCTDGPSEDLQLALCLEKGGVVPGDTRDPHGRHTFFPYRPQEHFHGKIPYNGDPKFWYYYTMKTGFEAFSENLITFHHMEPDELRLIELLAYRLRIPSRHVNL